MAYAFHAFIKACITESYADGLVALGDMLLSTRRGSLRPLVRIAFLCPVLSLPTLAWAAEASEVASPSNYGGVGLLDMRTARFFPDGYIVLTTSFTEPDDRYTITFQALPWAEMSFRYSITRAIFDTGTPVHDRSFDLKLRLVNEDEYVPQIALGLQDILGTGVYSGEYLAGSKRWGPFDFTLGMGWGRLGSRGTFKNPFGYIGSRFLERTPNTGVGGLPLFSAYFRGPGVGLFGGVEYHTPIDNLTMKLEYSSDAYDRERSESGKDFSFPFNVGLTYRPYPWLDVSVSLMHAKYAGLRLSVMMDPTQETWPARLDPPPRFRARGNEPAGSILRPEGTTLAPSLSQPAETRAVDLTQDSQTVAAPPPASLSEATPASSAPPPPQSIEAAIPLKSVLDSGSDQRIRAGLDTQKVALIALHAEDDTIEITIENGRYRRDTEAITRTARILSAEAPPAFNYFQITMMRIGLPITAVTIPRTAIDKLARTQGSPAEVFVATEFKPADENSLAHIQPGLFPQYSAFAYPVFRQSLFDPDNPVYLEFGIGATAGLRLSSGWFIEGAFVASLYDDFNQIKRESNSVLPHVRSDMAEYLKHGRYGLENFSTTYLFKFAPEVFGRVTAGYLERMLAGVGGEMLYRPFGKRWAIGVDLWTLRQRGFDVLFDLRDHDALTGHLTFYYDLPWHDVRASVSAGQYLAGDKGITFALTRRFLTGIQVGAWATFTNVSAQRFGEGSFDKGIRIVIPFEWAAPFATQSSYDLGLRPIQRDGGQRLDGDMVLYGITDPANYGALSQEWSSVFK